MNKRYVAAGYIPANTMCMILDEREGVIIFKEWNTKEYDDIIGKTNVTFQMGQRATLIKTDKMPSEWPIVPYVEMPIQETDPLPFDELPTNPRSQLDLGTGYKSAPYLSDVFESLVERRGGDIHRKIDVPRITGDE